MVLYHPKRRHKVSGRQRSEDVPSELESRLIPEHRVREQVRVSDAEVNMCNLIHYFQKFPGRIDAVPWASLGRPAILAFLNHYSMTDASDR